MNWKMVAGWSGCAACPWHTTRDDDIRQIFWGIGTHLGTAVYQSAKGEIMGEVRDETKVPDEDLRSAGEWQDHLVAGTRALDRSAALAHRSLRRDRTVVRAQCQGRRYQQAQQHRHDL